MPPKQNQQPQNQPPVASWKTHYYSSVFRLSVEALLKIQMPLFERLARILMGDEEAPANPHDEASRPLTASADQKNLFCSIGNALIKKFIPGFAPALNATNRAGLRRVRDANDNNNAGTVVAISQPAETDEDAFKRALAFAVFIGDQCFDPNCSESERSSFGFNVEISARSVLRDSHCKEEIVALVFNGPFLGRLFFVIDGSRFTWPTQPAHISDHAAFVAEFLFNLLLPQPRSANNDVRLPTPGSGIISSSGSLDCPSGQKSVSPQTRLNNIVTKKIKFPALMTHDDLANLRQIFVNNKNGPEQTYQDNLVSHFKNKSFAGRVVRPTTHSRKLTHPHDDSTRQVTVFVDGNETSTGRIGMIELTAGGTELKPLWKDVQTQYYMGAELRRNPCRRFIYGMITNGIWVRLYRAETAKDSFRVTYHVCCESENSVHNVVKCLHFMLYFDLRKALGFVDYPTVSINNNNASTSYTLGCMLGSGESCRTYGFVRPDSLNNSKKILAGDCEKAFVVKMFPTSDGAERESKFYDLLEQHNIRGTTRILRGANVNGVLPQTDGKMLVVTPRAEKFRVVYAGQAIDSNEPALQQITEDHVAQLVEALWSLHLIGVVHGDIQHQNLFYDSGDKSRAMLNDFGRSRMITSMKFSEFRAHMLRDWKMLEAAFCDPITSGSLHMANGTNAWKKFWESNQRRTERSMTEFIKNNFSNK